MKMPIKDGGIKSGFVSYSFNFTGFRQLLLFGSAAGDEYFPSLKVAVHVASSVYSE